MNQVGDIRIFSIAPPLPPEGVIYSYVWQWWDGTTEATVAPWARKTINIGGHPTTDLLQYSCTPVMTDGQAATLFGSITANHPPVLVPPVSVTVNDGYFPYDTQIKVKAYDPNNNTPYIFEWSENGVVLGAGSTAASGTVNGTWKGNGTVVNGTYNAFVNTFSLTVNKNRLLDLKVTDSRGGIARFQVELRGLLPPAAILGGGGGTVGVSSQYASTTRVGPGAEVVFELYARDPSGRGPLSFSWNFAGSNDWTVTAGPSPGVVTSTPDGGRKTVFIKDVSGELFPEGDRKTVKGLVTVAWPGGAKEVAIPATLLANNPPSGITFTATVNGNDYPWGSNTTVDPGAIIEFTARSSDPDLDLVAYEWLFVQPSSATPPTTLRVWGAKLVLDTVNYPAGSRVEATVTATDRFGALVSEVTPPIPITPTPPAVSQGA